MFRLIGVLVILTFSVYAEDTKEGDDKAKLQPVNLDFAGLEKEIAAYIEAFPEERRKPETRRVGIVKNFKKMVQKVVNRRAYEGKIFLKGSVLVGKIVEAKDDSLVIVDSKGEDKNVKWEDLNLRTFSDIFISEAISKGEELSAGKRPENADDAFKKAANYYFALAVFYDWYGNSNAAKLFKNKALILNPEKKAEIEELWPPGEELKN